MHKIIIVEDDYKNMEVLKDMLSTYFPDLWIAACPQNMEEGIALIQEHEPTLVFLDVQLPDGDGFELLNRVRKYDFDVIFTTAYDQYMLNAFNAEAIHYLLKPINIQQLKIAVKRYLKKQIAPPSPLSIAAPSKKKIERIAIHSHKEIKFIILDQIIYFEASGSYTLLHLNNTNQPIIASKGIGFYEKLLTEAPFSRIHSSYIINLKCVQKYIKGKGGFVELINGRQLMVSSRKKTDFLTKIEGFISA